MHIKEYIKKLQELPYLYRVVILWTIVAIIAAILLFFWVDVAAKRLAQIKEDLQKSQSGSKEAQDLLQSFNNLDNKGGAEDELPPNN